MTVISANLTEEMDQMVVTSQGFTRGQLKDAFDRICDQDNWKMPFHCIVSGWDIELYNEACMFFTGARLEIIDYSSSDYKCYCKGYYNAVGA